MKPALLLAAGLLLAGCLDNTQPHRRESSFDVAAYFKSEATRIQTAGSAEMKTAVANGQSQTLRVERPDWQQELAPFSRSVIDKPAWAGKYRRSVKDNVETWTTTDAELPTRRVSIWHSGKSISRVEIVNSSANALYRSHETLTWLPDSGYTLRKQQSVRFLAPDTYVIRGKIISPR